MFGITTITKLSPWVAENTNWFLMLITLIKVNQIKVPKWKNVLDDVTSSLRELKTKM